MMKCFQVLVSISTCAATPWRADVYVTDVRKHYVIGQYADKKEAARAYDAEIRRRGTAVQVDPIALSVEVTTCSI